MERDVLLNVISLVCSRLKRAKDSYEVFKSVLNLIQASKLCQNYFSEEDLVKISYRYVRERTRFIHNKLKYLIRKNDANGFTKLADLFVKYFSKYESLHALNNLVEYVTRHASLDFLRGYLEYFQSRNLHAESSYKGSSNWYSFPHFRPRNYIGAVILANNSEWIDKQTVLYDHLMTDLNVPPSFSLRAHEMVTKPGKLNFYTALSYLSDLYSHKYEKTTYIYPIVPQENFPTNDPVPLNGVRPTLEDLQMPIEEHPWCYGNLTELELRLVFNGCTTQDCFITVFYGSRYFYHQSATRRIPFNQTTWRRLPKYGLINNREKNLNGTELYQFYQCVVQNDLEGAKKLQAKHGFDWEKISKKWLAHQETYSTQPHPLFEYLNCVDNICSEVVDWLLKLSSFNTLYFSWDRDHIPDQHFEILQKIFLAGPFIPATFLRIFLTKVMLSNKKDILPQTLKAIRVCESGRINVMKFIEETFGDICRQQKFISVTKMTTFLAWKYASGESVGFTTLPKELVKIIIEFIAEPSLVESLLTVYMHQHRYYFRGYKFPEEFVKKNPWVVELVEKYK